MRYGHFNTARLTFEASDLTDRWWALSSLEHVTLDTLVPIASSPSTPPSTPASTQSTSERTPAALVLVPATITVRALIREIRCRSRHAPGRWGIRTERVSLHRMRQLARSVDPQDPQHHALEWEYQVLRHQAFRNPHKTKFTRVVYA
jgi:hypothetical protein